jgi:hypothetical protein
MISTECLCKMQGDNSLSEQFNTQDVTYLLWFPWFLPMRLSANQENHQIALEVGKWKTQVIFFYEKRNPTRKKSVQKNYWNIRHLPIQQNKHNGSG